MPEREEITWVFEDQEELAPSSAGPEFGEIPAEVKRAADLRLREEALAVLHAEAVDSRELPLAPSVSSRSTLGRILGLVFFLLFGGALGVGAVVTTAFLTRTVFAALL